MSEGQEACNSTAAPRALSAQADCSLRCRLPPNLSCLDLASVRLHQAHCLIGRAAHRSADRIVHVGGELPGRKFDERR